LLVLSAGLVVSPPFSFFAVEEMDEDGDGDEDFLFFSASILS
jgi:hypothetical protein